MATHRPGYERENSVSSMDDLNNLGTVQSELKEKTSIEKGGVLVVDSEGDSEHLDAANMLANGKERPIETANDIATRSVPFRLSDLGSIELTSRPIQMRLARGRSDTRLPHLQDVVPWTWTHLLR